METTAVPSIQVAIGHRGKLVFEYAAGFASLEHNVRATTNSVYRTASISKWFSAVAALKLSELGKLDLDRDVSIYCSAFPKKPSVVTTRQILGHTSGIRHYEDYDALLDKAETDDEKYRISAKRNAAMLELHTHYTDRVGPLDGFKSDPLLFEPGSGWHYSSHAYRLLGCVLEGASGNSYADLMQEYVFGPAGLKAMAEDDAWSIIPHRASGYDMMRGGDLRPAEHRNTSSNLPAGGHLTTAADLVRFSHAFNNGTLVSSANVQRMIMPVKAGSPLRAKSSWRDAIPSSGHYGYGVMMFPSENGLRYGHTGRQPGASSIVVYDPSTDVTIAVLTNVKGWRGYVSFTNELFDTIAERLDQTE